MKYLKVHEVNHPRVPLELRRRPRVSMRAPAYNNICSTPLIPFISHHLLTQTLTKEQYNTHTTNAHYSRDTQMHTNIIQNDKIYKELKKKKAFGIYPRNFSPPCLSVTWAARRGVLQVRAGVAPSFANTLRAHTPPGTPCGIVASARITWHIPDRVSSLAL